MTLLTPFTYFIHRILSIKEFKWITLRFRPNDRLTIVLPILLIILAFSVTGCNAGRNLGAQDKGWSPVVASEGVVYVGSITGQVLALKDDGRSVQLIWSFPENEDESIGGVYNPPVVGPEL